MIFFVGNGGTIIKNIPEPVYQGAANANTVYVIAPFASNSVCTAAFLLPNGAVYPAEGRVTMAQQGAIDGIINEETGGTYSGWSYDLPNNITSYSGTVTVQFYFTNAAGNVVASSGTSFSVGKGVPPILPETPDQDTYEEILANIASLQEQLTSGMYAARAFYAWSAAATYGENEITFYPVGEYGVFVQSLIDGNSNHPPYEDGELNSTYWKVVADLNDMYSDIPEPTESNNGQVLGVENGKYAFVDVDTGQETIDQILLGSTILHVGTSSSTHPNTIEFYGTGVINNEQDLQLHMILPVKAGEGIQFTADDTENRIVISATGGGGDTNPEIPDPTEADSGKVLGVSEEGKYVLLNPGTAGQLVTLVCLSNLVGPDIPTDNQGFSFPQSFFNRTPVVNDGFTAIYHLTSGSEVLATYSLALVVISVSEASGVNAQVRDVIDITSTGGGTGGDGIENNEVIVQYDTLPTATADSPDFVQTPDGTLYRKSKRESAAGAYTWNNTPASPTAAINASIDFTYQGAAQTSMSIGSTGGIVSIAYYPAAFLYTSATGWGSLSKDFTIQSDEIPADLAEYLSTNATRQGAATILYSYEVVGGADITFATNEEIDALFTETQAPTVETSPNSAGGTTYNITL